VPVEAVRRRRLLIAAGVGLAAPALVAGCAAPAARYEAAPRSGAEDLALLNRLTWEPTLQLAAWSRLGRHDYLQSQLHAGVRRSCRHRRRRRSTPCPSLPGHAGLGR
jgi:hypothetical protein